MTRKERIELLISKVSADQKEAFIEELRGAKTKEERLEVAKKFNATLTEEEAKEFMKETANEVSDEDLDTAAGGCSPCNPKCECYCYCSGSCS